MTSHHYTSFVSTELLSISLMLSRFNSPLAEADAGVSRKTMIEALSDGGFVNQKSAFDTELQQYHGRLTVRRKAGRIEWSLDSYAMPSTRANRAFEPRSWTSDRIPFMIQIPEPLRQALNAAFGQQVFRAVPIGLATAMQEHEPADADAHLILEGERRYRVLQLAHQAERAPVEAPKAASKPVAPKVAPKVTEPVREAKPAQPKPERRPMPKYTLLAHGDPQRNMRMEAVARIQNRQATERHAELMQEVVAHTRRAESGTAAAKKVHTNRDRRVRSLLKEVSDAAPVRPADFAAEVASHVQGGKTLTFSIPGIDKLKI